LARHHETAWWKEGQKEKCMTVNHRKKKREKNTDENRLGTVIKTGKRQSLQE